MFAFRRQPPIFYHPSSTRPRNSSHPPGNDFIHNSNRELRARHRAVQTRASLEHARAAIDDLVQSNANNDESLETVHIIHTVDDKQLLRVGGARLGVTARQDRARRRRVDELESSQSARERLAELLNKRFIGPTTATRSSRSSKSASWLLNGQKCFDDFARVGSPLSSPSS